MAKSKKQSKSQTSIQVDLVSDFVCPWCWLGYKQFMAAADSAKPKPQVTLRPFMLDPSVPDEGMDYKDYMRAKFGEGSSDRFQSTREHLETEGEKLGLSFDFSAITRRPNSLNAHRLLKWAQGQDLGNACAEALFRAYHEEGKDIGDAATLSDIATSIGMDGSLVLELLKKDDDKLAIQQEAMFFKGLGISGVPTFIYNGNFAVQGAQPAENHKRAFREALKQPAATDD